MIQSKPYLRSVSLKDDKTLPNDPYPFGIPSIRNLGELAFHPDVTFLTGENGAGKSTLIEAIALALGFGIEGGTKNVTIQTHQNASQLFQYLKTVKGHRKPGDYYFLRAESYYNVVSYLEEIDKGMAKPRKSLHHCSHGEAFMATLTQRLRGDGLYLFDEPEAALSPNRQLAALSAIHQLVERRSQLIIATHSPILLAYPNSRIYHLDETGIKAIGYEETEQFQTTKRFLSDYRSVLKQLLT